MTDNQKQSVSAGGTGAQAGRDLIINQGISPTQMVEIMDALGQHVERLAATAREQVDKRLDEFRQSVLEKFATDSSARTEAFAEPDFQAALLDAQKSYARSGDENLQKVLTDLIAQRSKQQQRNRLSLSLNDAIAKAAVIPQPDLNTMTLMFMLQNVQHNGIAHLGFLALALRSFYDPFLDSLSISESAFQYLAAHGCLTTAPGGISYFSGRDMLLQRYGPILTKGFSEEALRERFPDFEALKSKRLISASPFDGDLLILTIGDPSMIRANFPQIGILGNYAEEYEAMAKQSVPNREELIGAISKYFPRFREFLDFYDQRFVRDSRLTSIGIALAHANLLTRVSLGADLSIWIQD